MNWFRLCLALVVMFTCSALAQEQQYWCPKCGKYHNTQTVQYQAERGLTLTERKARLSAQIGISRLRTFRRSPSSVARFGMRHVMQGQFVPGARFEGVGYSTISARHAIQMCCYWGQKTPVQIGTAADGRGGFYAVVQYR